MGAKLVWSFQLAKDFTGRYETAKFHREFWYRFLAGSGLYLLGCAGLGGVLKLRAAIIAGVTALLVGIVILVSLMPFVDFEGWTGATTYTLVSVEFMGAVVILLLAGIKRLVQAVRMSRR